MDRVGSSLTLVGQLRTILIGGFVLTMSGCASGMHAPPETAIANQLSGMGGIRGVVRHSRTGDVIANAKVVLKCDCLSRRLFTSTDDHGTYSFAGLRPGHYEVRVFAGEAKISKLFRLPEGAKYRANFSLDPASDLEIEFVIDKRLPLPVGGRSTDCFVVDLPWPIHFRITVGNSLQDAIEQQSYYLY